MPTVTGVYPVHGIDFKVNTSGANGAPTAMKPIADMQSFKISIDGKVVEWSPFEEKGWYKRLVTAKKLAISLSGKRCYGDPGNDYIAGLALALGQDCNTKVEIVFPDGAKLAMSAVVDIKEYLGGESEDVVPLSFDLLSNSKPTYTAAPSTP